MANMARLVVLAACMSFQETELHRECHINVVSVMSRRNTMEVTCTAQKTALPAAEALNI